MPLQVGIGRYRNLPPEDRLCTVCDLALVEDELHLLCVCTRYAQDRANLYGKAEILYPSFYQLDDLDKFVQLISNMQKEVIDFLGCAPFLRRSCLYST